MATCQDITRRAVITAAGTAALIRAPATVRGYEPDAFIPLATEFLALVGNDEAGDLSAEWTRRVAALEEAMTDAPPRTIAGVALGLRVLRANAEFGSSDLEVAIVDAAIRVLEAEGRA